MKNKLNDIWRNITYLPKRKFRQIKNVISWIPVVWNQFDFDYRYSLEVFKHQLSKQAKYLESDKPLGIGAKHRAEKIRMVLRLMDKVYDEEYACEYQDRLKEKYGEGVDDMRFIDIPDKPGYSELKWAYEVDEKWEHQHDQIEEDKSIWFKESHEKQERAHKLLWKLIEFYIRRWWD
jgi:hypothetical protein